MSALRSLLTLYSALDQAVIQARDPLVAETVDRFLPGASRNAGWSDEIRQVFFPDEPRLDDIGAGVGEALDGIVNRLSDEPAPSIPMQSRMVYVLGALTHIQASEAFTRNNQGFLDALKVAQSAEQFESGGDERAQELFTFLAGNFTSWRDWDEITRMSVLQGWLDPLIADVPLCFPAVVTVEGKKCVVIDAVLTSNTVKFTNLKNVVDALNWPKAYPSFFCCMQDLGLRADKWRGVLETAGFCYDGSYLLKTPLKYIKSAPNDRTACLDYDLIEKDPEKAKKLGGDGKVLVDRGYINIRCTSPGYNPYAGGVWVRSRKVAHVTGLSPYAQAKFLCICGYAYAAAEMLFGAAEDVENDPDAYRPWEDEPLKDAADLEKDMEDAAAAAGAPASGGTTPPPPPPMDAVTKIVEKWKGCVDLLTKTHLDLTGKWLNNQLSYGELAKASAEVGAKVASDPWVLLHELTQPPTTPPTPPGPVETPGGDS
jgi:hypothetical protein